MRWITPWSVQTHQLGKKKRVEVRSRALRGARERSITLLQFLVSPATLNVQLLSVVFCGRIFYFIIFGAETVECVCELKSGSCDSNDADEVGKWWARMLKVGSPLCSEERVVCVLLSSRSSFPAALSSPGRLPPTGRCDLSGKPRDFYLFIYLFELFLCSLRCIYCSLFLWTCMAACEQSPVRGGTAWFCLLNFTVWGISHPSYFIGDFILCVYGFLC